MTTTPMSSNLGWAARAMRWLGVDFGFDLAGRDDPALFRGAWVSALASIAEAIPLAVLYFALREAFDGQATWNTVLVASAVLFVSTGLTWWLKSRAMVDNFVSTYGLVGDIRMRLADHLRRLPMGFFSNRRTGSLASTLTDQFSLYSDIVTHIWGLVVANIALPLAIVVVMLLVDVRLAVAALITLPIALPAIPWSHRLLNRAADAQHTTYGRTLGRLVEYVQGMREIRAFGRVGRDHASLRDDLDALRQAQMTTELAPAPAILAFGLLLQLGFASLLTVGAWMVAGQSLSAPAYLLFLVLSLRFYAAVADLSIYLAEARFATRTLERIRALFDEPQQPDAKASQTPSDGSIEVEHLQLAYEDRPTLVDVSARFEAGTVTALVGPSGSGKTTLAHLLIRLWDRDAGSIRLGGQPLESLSLATLHRNVAVVFQDVVLFRDTVADNIRLARPHASHDEVVAAAKAARAHDFILQLPDGYDTVLGEGGADLSGGQRQRLSIARALLKDAPVLILDEATASIDPHNEQAIQEALSGLMKGRTVIVIAHRLWTIQHADQILVFDHGHIVERGTHEDLLGRNDGLYRRQWDLQQQVRHWKAAPAVARTPLTTAP